MTEGESMFVLGSRVASNESLRIFWKFGGFSSKIPFLSKMYGEYMNIRDIMAACSRLNVKICRIF